MGNRGDQRMQTSDQLTVSQLLGKLFLVKFDRVFYHFDIVLLLRLVHIFWVLTWLRH